MAAFRGLVLHLLPEQCYDEFFVKFNFFHVECLKLALAKCLGLGIIAGSVLVKVPQIAKIMAAQSAEGISLTGSLLELSALTSSAAYHYANSFPFSAWGESLFLILQTATINFLVLMFTRKLSLSVGFLLAYLVIAYLLVCGLTPLAVLWFLQASVIPLVIFSKLIQAYANYKNGSTGQLSAATVFLLFVGSVARIFTSVQETGDPLIVATYAVTSSTNGIIAAQMLYYWKAKPKFANSAKAKKSSATTKIKSSQNVIPKSSKNKIK